MLARVLQLRLYHLPTVYDNQTTLAVCTDPFFFSTFCTFPLKLDKEIVQYQRRGGYTLNELFRVT